MNENKKYLTVHGHFYQPPRENPWIEEIELQESAHPQHDWNEKISWQCYRPNGSSRIVDGNNSIVEISNNYRYMSFNFGATLLSWLEKYDTNAYHKILEADKLSISEHNGHGNAIAQVYNHIIMPLANRNDKITQVLWGLKDFQKRFNRNSEGIWLAETAVDAQTLEVLIDCGVKFTILSPHQAKCVNKIGEKNWQDVSWGTIDPSRAYRYYVDGTNKEKYIDLFFYDGSISKSVAFDNLLCDGVRFAHRLNDGYVEDRHHPQIINIATDGESYGHHTKFGDMALAYILRVGAKNLGFTITNYGEFLEKYPPEYEVDIKPVSAWSCCHGIGRWQDNCGCSTGAQPHWNQAWRKPLRQAMDYLRDEMIKLCTQEGAKYYKNFWEARNNYIDVIISRSKTSIEKFLLENTRKNLSSKNKVQAIKLMEIQRFCQLMYTSCGWFFADISGIETTQIMKYAARAIELAKEFSDTNFEKHYLSILQKAKSNIHEFGSGKEIYNKWVKTSVVSVYKVGAQFAIESEFDANKNNEIFDLYCYEIKKHTSKKTSNSIGTLTIGKFEIASKITLEKRELSYVMLQTHHYDFYCFIKDFNCQDDYNIEKDEILKEFKTEDITNILKTIKLYYGSKSYGLIDIPIDRRKSILKGLVVNKLEKAAETYKELYESLLKPISYLNDIGMDIPESFRVCAKYTLVKSFKKELSSITTYTDKKKSEKLIKIKELTDKFHIKLNKHAVMKILSDNLLQLTAKLKEAPNGKNTRELLNFFDLMEKLKTELEISESQNVFYDLFCSDFENFVEKLRKKHTPNELRKLLLDFVEIGKKLNINVAFYKEKIDSLTGKV